MQALTALATSARRRYGTHLFTSLTSVGFHSINCVNGKEARNIMEWHSEKTTGTNGVLYIAFTAEEYNSLNGDYTGLQANMRRPFCEYMIYNASPFDAHNFDIPRQSTRFANTMSSTSSWTIGLAWDYNAMVSLSHLLQQPTWTRLQQCLERGQETRENHCSRNCDFWRCT